MMLRSQAGGDTLEIRYRGDGEYQIGDEVTLTV